ncbi:MAG TPA: hypothetical protein VFV54_05340, partial [Thermoanaerobaculia bacterium]|nr:hypothetical protein [Thermoanaerobaculia bacterium]
KIDNRGPDPARVIDLWVTLPVKQFSSAIRGTLTRVGPFTRIRFEPSLLRGAGFEVAMYFDAPIDTSAVEGWVTISGTDRVISNNYVSTLPQEEEPAPEPPSRRRLAGRP